MLIALLALPVTGGIIDRLAVAVGKQVITQLQLDEELRVTAMLNRKPVVRSLEARRAAADRLVEQFLIKLEMELGRYPLPAKADVDRYLEEVRGQLGADFAQDLGRFSLTEETVRRHLELQLTELRFIEYRFRPDVSISDADIENAYRRQAASWKLTHAGEPPTLEASREPLRAMLIEENIDAALNIWLAEDRRQVNIVYFDKTLE